MKKVVFIYLLFLSAPKTFSQKEPADTNYATRITSIEWMPDGKAILFSLVKFHKTNRQAPFFSRIFRCDIVSRKVVELFNNGSNIAPAPDGKRIAFMKRDDPKRSALYIYDTETSQETEVKSDTTRKNALSWSPDGSKLMFNTSPSANRSAPVEISILDLASGQVKQITQSSPDKNYNPVWCPDSRRIVYYVEKGDNHDQIWLTDADGSFHTNLTNDPTTQNFFPSWLDEKTILYTEAPENIVTMNADGTHKENVKGIRSYLVKPSPDGNLLAHLAPQPENKILLFDRKRKISTILLDESVLNTVWK